jgi:type VII secretion-associated serine protease mycosin
MRAVAASLATVVVAAGLAGAATIAGPASAAPARPAVVAGSPPRIDRSLTARIPKVDDDHVLVRLATTPRDLNARFARAGAQVKRTVPGTKWIELATGRGRARAVAARLKRDRTFARVELSYIRHAATVPNDPLWNGTQSKYLGPLRMDRAWDKSKGAGVTVAVVDSGVDFAHPDLAGRFVTGRNMLNPGSPPQDDLGHGTAVSGVLAANMNNRRGIAGIAPQAKIMPIKALDGAGNGTDPDIAAGIDWARTHGAKVINLSLSGPVSSGVLADAVANAVAADIVVVGAAGNDGSEGVSYPGAYPGVIAVSATTASGAFAAFSSWGWRVDVAAPGLDITSALLGFGDEYIADSGTSFSAPIVAGTAALLRSRNPSWDAATVAARIRDTARDAGPAGVDPAFGHGIVDPLAALGGPAAAPRPARRDAGDEPIDAPGDATPLPLGAARNAKIAPELDNDWYSLEVTTPGWYSINVPAGNPALDHFMDPIIELYNGDLAFQASNDLASGALVAHIETTGTSYVRVRNRGGDTASYAVTAKAIGAPDRFAPPIELDFGAEAASTVMGDVNGDGRSDIAFAFGDNSLLPNLLVVLYQTTTRSYVFGSMLTTDATSGGGMAIGDLDNDADHVADIAIPVTNGVAVYGRSGFGMDLLRTIATPATPTQLAIADVNGDSVNDLVASGSFGIRVLPGPNYDAPVTVTSDAAAATLAVGDVTGDGRPDVVTCCVKLYAQNADHTFATVATTAVAGAAHVALGDLNDDDLLDVVATVRTTPGAVSRLFQNAGALDPPASSPTVDARPQPIAVADVDADGRHDVVVLHNVSAQSSAPVNFGWLRQRADGTLAPELVTSIDDFAASYDARALTVADADRDGLPDVGVATKYGYALALQHSDPLPTLETAWIRSVAPANLAEDQSASTVPSVTFGRAVTDADASSVQLLDGGGNAVGAQVGYDGDVRTATITPDAPLPDGRYTVRLHGVHDDAGNVLDDYGSSFIVGPIDLTAPQTALTSPPTGFQTSSVVTMKFSASGATSFQCSLDNEPYHACTSPQQFGVGPGTHTFKVFARDAAGNEDTTPASTTWTYRKSPSGYWMLATNGVVYPFGSVPRLGNANTRTAIDFAASPTGFGYWVVDTSGHVFSFGDAPWHGNARGLRAGELVTSISRTASGRGYWLFTNRGMVLPFGDAKFFGDKRNQHLNGPVLDSVVTPSGKGYYMVASDGGVFTFGDARFYGSTGNLRLRAPVRTLVPDTDGQGYWLVGYDGGVFSFSAPFRGSMGGKRLNRPIVGTVTFGKGYLMVGSDGGIFNFSDLPFLGSLGNAPPAAGIVAVDAFDS